MIDYDDLINRIEGMHDLPVSEEMLGAYCEDSLNLVDAAEIDSFITNDAELSELVDNVDNLQVFDDSYSFDYSTCSTDDIELPSIPTDCSSFPFEMDILPNVDDIEMVAAAAVVPTFCDFTEDFDTEKYDFIGDDDDSFQDDNHSLEIDDNINSDDLFDNLNPDEL